MAPETRNIQRFSDKLSSEPTKYTVQDVGGGGAETKEIIFAGAITQAGTKNKADYFNNIQKSLLFKVGGIRAIEGSDEKYDISITGSSSFDIFEYQFIFIPDVTNTHSGVNVILRFNATEYTIKIEEDGVNRDVIAGDLIADTQYQGYLDHNSGQFLLKKWQGKKLEFDTIAEMQLATYLDTGDTVTVRGYYTKGDGGEHQRIIAIANDGTGIAFGVKFANVVSKGEYNIKSLGVKGDGATDETVLLQSIFDNVPVGSLLYFPNATYLFSADLTIDRRIKIHGESHDYCYLENTGVGNAIEINDDKTEIRDIYIKGNGASGNGVVIDAKQVKLENVFVANHNGHGIVVEPDNWTITIDKCTSYNNGGDGIYAVSSGPSGQINALNITGCLLWNNTGNGIKMNGTGVNILHCDIESNQLAGVLIDTTNNSTYNTNILDNYMEGNFSGHVVMDLYPSTGNRIFSLNIDNNYFLATDLLVKQENAGAFIVGKTYTIITVGTTDFTLIGASANNVGVTFIATGVGAGNGVATQASVIKATTDTINDGIRNMKIGAGNLMFVGVIKHVELNNAVQLNGEVIIESQLCGDTPDFSFFYANLGSAGVRHYQNTFVLSGFFHAKGISYSTPEKSDNILGSIGSVTARYPIPVNNGNQYKKASVYIETDSTDYGVTFTLYKINAKNGTAPVAVTTEFKSGNSGNKNVVMTDIVYLTNPNNGRVQAYEEYYLQLQFSNLDVLATNFQVHNPIVFFIK